MSLTQQEIEIQEVIKKNLPAHVGDILKERLAQADNDAKDLKNEKILTGSLQKTIEKLEGRIREYEKKDDKYRTLIAKEAELDAVKRNLEVEKLTYELACEKDKTQFSKDVALGLVRNTSYRKTIFDTENPGGHGIQDANGIWHYPMHTSKSFTETKGEE